ncbi:glycosyltransferase family 4 protein [Rhodococcus sp. IEGM 1408]|uniref:glycosyltransferase family 4 protein n=1 Tax=Rhodococcus sp. IEGM 1408 TaxID=3082220 RepID=UPI002954D1C9|nr:glycosyltransferase family 4 protein [Rhodococcus sp. IEGM 1408]MDV7999971.1 glycosyltransferase family 4 protein [Rhodococcus sp. IEGM 1408]
MNPYPSDAGKKVVLAGLLEYFAHRHGADSVHYIHVGPMGDTFPTAVTTVSGPRTHEAMWQVLTRTTTGRASLQESLLRSPRTGAEIRHALGRLRPDVIVYDTLRMAQYAGETGATQQICYLDDLFSERYSTMLRTAAQYPEIDIAPLGNFAAFVPSLLRPIAGHRRGWQTLLAVERRLVRRGEDRMPHRLDRALLISEPEARTLRARTGLGDDRIMSVPPLLREPARRPRRPSEDPTYVFLGQLSLPHNDDGLRSFLGVVWPLVLAAEPRARLRIIGRSPRDGLTEAAAAHGDSVFFEGFVPDLGEALGSATAMVNHLRFGSGIKLKVIEALGHALPVVSTPIGAHGIDSGDGSGLLVGETPESFASHLLSLTDATRNAEYSEAALSHFTRAYARDAVMASYDRAFAAA